MFEELVSSKESSTLTNLVRGEMGRKRTCESWRVPGKRGREIRSGGTLGPL